MTAWPVLCAARAISLKRLNAMCSFCCARCGSPRPRPCCPEAIRRNPNNAELIDLLGFTRLRLENWLGAEQAARDLQSLNPERAQQLRAAILIGQERFDEGASLLRDLPTDTSRRSASISALVQTYVRDGQTEEAVAFLEELLIENPENIQALGLRGNLHMANGEFEEAEARFRKILELQPTSGGAHSALSRLFARQGRRDEAESQLLQGLETSPDNLILLARLAQYSRKPGPVRGGDRSLRAAL